DQRGRRLHAGEVVLPDQPVRLRGQWQGEHDEIRVSQKVRELGQRALPVSVSDCCSGAPDAQYSHAKALGECSKLLTDGTQPYYQHGLIAETLQSQQFPAVCPLVVAELAQPFCRAEDEAEGELADF